MLQALKKIFGSKSDKDIKLLLPIVDEINAHFSQLESLSEEQLKAKTDEFRAQINEVVNDLVAEQAEIQERLRTDADIEHSERANLYARLAENDREQYQAIQEKLTELLPEAFAVVKEACRRLVGHTYDVVGQEQTWDMVPYDVQLIGGTVLHQGKISEMATGEGKTLVATLPLYLNALPGRGVHLVQGLPGRVGRLPAVAVGASGVVHVVRRRPLAGVRLAARGGQSHDGHEEDRPANAPVACLLRH